MSPALIKEMISYNPDINVDRVSALSILMILREDRVKYTEISKKSSVVTKSQDKMWDRAFHGSNRHMARLRFE